MRPKLGFTNSPTVVAFRGMYRKILAGIDNIFVTHSNVTRARFVFLDIGANFGAKNYSRQ